MAKTEIGNPVVKQTRLMYHLGWVVREYRDGTFDAAQVVGAGLSPGVKSFADAVAWVRKEMLS